MHSNISDFSFLIEEQLSRQHTLGLVFACTGQSVLKSWNFCLQTPSATPLAEISGKPSLQRKMVYLLASQD